MYYLVNPLNSPVKDKGQISSLKLHNTKINVKRKIQIHLSTPKSFPIFLLLSSGVVFLRDNILDLEVEKQVRENGIIEMVVSTK